MNTISDPIRERISAPQLSYDIVSQLSECALTLEGCRGAIQAIDSNIYSDKMNDERLSATLWLLGRQLEKVQGVIEAALRGDGGRNE